MAKQECTKQLVLRCPPSELIKLVNKTKAEILENNPHRRNVISNTEAVMKLIKKNSK